MAWIFTCLGVPNFSAGATNYDSGGFRFVMPKEINQLHIIEGLSDIGGTARGLLTLVRYSEISRSKYIFLCYQADAAPLAPLFRDYGAEVVIIDTLSPIKIALACIRLARCHGADIICTHFTRSLVSGAIAAATCELPLVHYIHGSFFGWKRRQRLIEGVMMKSADLIICNSAHTQLSIEEGCRVSHRKTHVLNCPVEERKTTREANVVRSALGWGDATIVVGHVGGMIGLRDQKTLLRAFASFNMRRPDSGLLLIGDGPLRRELESFAGELGISDQVKFLGYSLEVGNFLRAMDIYVNPAYLEGFGIAVGEAMLARLPVVLANGGSHPELIEDGQSGLLYPPGNAMVLTSIFNQLADDPKLRIRMGEEARAHALDIFSPERIALKQGALIAEVMERTNRRHHRRSRVN